MPSSMAFTATILFLLGHQGAVVLPSFPTVAVAYPFSNPVYTAVTRRLLSMSPTLGTPRRL